MSLSQIELLVVWKHPTLRDRFVIGRLRRAADGYSYQNVLDQQHSLADAQEAGFTPLALFGTDDKWHRSDTLFPPFARRLPPDWRKGEYAQLGLRADQDLEYLMKTGGRMAGDTFEFLRPIPQGDTSGELRLDFPVAGWRYYDGEKALKDLEPGSPLRLELEVENEFDKSAIKILAPDGSHLGYVPRIYSWYIDDCIEEQRYTALVKELGPPEAPQLRMTVELMVTDPHLRQIPEGIKVLASV